jgi:uncharacterized protein
MTDSHSTGSGTRTAAIDGWFTLDETNPALVGSRCQTCRTYVFPPASLACPNPDCDSVSFDSVELSRRGRIWSYTDARYKPPAPYVASDPYEPFCLAAVELAEERLVVLGQVVPGFTVDDLHVGMEVELVLGSLHSSPGDDGNSGDGNSGDGKSGDGNSGDVLIWKWRPAPGGRPQGTQEADR